jgi:hypothetical protein
LVNVCKSFEVNHVKRTSFLKLRKIEKSINETIMILFPSTLRKFEFQEKKETKIKLEEIIKKTKSKF